jgi:hypothetical protein
MERYWRQKADAEPELTIALAANPDQILLLKKFFSARQSYVAMMTIVPFRIW